MAEYIEREALKKKLGDLHFPNYGYALIAINEMPAADVVEVVRCGICQYFDEPYCIRNDDETHRERINMLTVDFCSYGKRRCEE